MNVTALYIEDKKCFHVKFHDLYPSDKDNILRVNGENITLNISQWDYNIPDQDLMVLGETLKIERGYKETYVSHYIHKETKEEMSVFDFEETLKGFRDSNGEYKNLDCEYQYRKMVATYQPVKNEYTSYTEIPVTVECASSQIDDYITSAGIVGKKDTGNYSYKNFFVFKFNLRKFAEDTIREIMKKYNVEERTDGTSKLKETYMIYPETETYKFLSFCGSDYFIKLEDLFFFDRCRFLGYFYGSLDEVIAKKEAIKQKIENKIVTELDCRRTTYIRKSVLANIKSTLNSINSSLSKQEILSEVKNVIEELNK